MKIKTAFLTLLAAPLLLTGTAHAFEAVSYKEVPGLVGKQVYACTNTDLGKGWAYAGEPLTVVSAAPYQQQAGITTYNFIRVKTKEGKEGQIQLRFLSKSPLKFNLRSPGTARQLLVAVLNDAYPLAAKMHEMRDRAHYNLDSSTQPDEYHQVDSMDEAFKFERNLVHNLIYSSNSSKEDVLRNDNTKWIAAASDPTILDFYADGIQDAKTKAKFVNADNALSTLDSVSSFGFDIARLEQEKSEKSWRKGMDGVPADKLAKLDAEKTAALNKDIQGKQKRLKASFAEAAASKARAQ